MSINMCIGIAFLLLFEFVMANEGAKQKTDEDYSACNIIYLKATHRDSTDERVKSLKVSFDALECSKRYFQNRSLEKLALEQRDYEKLHYPELNKETGQLSLEYVALLKKLSDEKREDLREDLKWEWNSLKDKDSEVDRKRKLTITTTLTELNKITQAKGAIGRAAVPGTTIP